MGTGYWATLTTKSNNVLVGILEHLELKFATEQGDETIMLSDIKGYHAREKDEEMGRLYTGSRGDFGANLMEKLLIKIGWEVINIEAKEVNSFQLQAAGN
jgi:hypothetical protein